VRRGPSPGPSAPQGCAQGEPQGCDFRRVPGRGPRTPAPRLALTSNAGLACDSFVQLCKGLAPSFRGDRPGSRRMPWRISSGVFMTKRAVTRDGARSMGVRRPRSSLAPVVAGPVHRQRLAPASAARARRAPIAVLAAPIFRVALIHVRETRCAPVAGPPCSSRSARGAGRSRTGSVATLLNRAGRCH